MSTDILLATINAKWIHPSLALRLLKANIGSLEKHCGIIEFALRQPVQEKIDPILAARPRILGFSVSIWNHIATLELLKELRKAWSKDHRPVVVLGGPEVSYLSPDAEIFSYADYCIMGEAEIAFRKLCECILNGVDCIPDQHLQQVDIGIISSGYRLYTDEDLRKKLVYVEASRGCPFHCEFCLSPIQSGMEDTLVREFPLERFLAEMDELIRRGTRTFKFLDRSFNLNIERARRIMDFFLEKTAQHEEADSSGTWKPPFVVHFEMIPSRFPPELVETLAHFPPGALRLEIGIQTLNAEVSARIGRPSDPERELENLRLLREKTDAIIHADLIAGLPGEDMDSVGRGFDLLWDALAPVSALAAHGHAEIQLGILKLLPGAPIARHSETFGMRYSSVPPYELVESAALPASDLGRIKNFARFWEVIVNRRLADIGGSPVFDRFMALSDSLAAGFGRSWGIDKKELQMAVYDRIPAARPPAISP